MEKMTYIKNIDPLNLISYIPKNSVLFFDTESSFINDNNNIPMKLEDNTPNPEYITDVHVYAWAISNNNNDNVIYGHNLHEFMDFLYNLQLSWFEDKIYLKEDLEKVLPKLEIWVHNLQWDLEFLKYELEKQLYTYENSKVTPTREKVHKKITRGHYNIIENANIVYACMITHKKAIKIRYTYKKQIKTSLQQINISFHDSMKVINSSLDNIALNILTLPKERLKIHGYDYDLHRPIGHILTESEQEYLYNDVYILKEFYNQYYKPLGTIHKTASGIAFEKICKSVYGDKFNYKKDFLKHFPEVFNYTSKNLIEDSYQGGITQVNRKYLNKVQQFKNKAVSIDIVSSYPSVLVTKPLPIGKPIMTYNFESNTEILKDKEKYHTELQSFINDPEKIVLIQIGFDAFCNKDKNNLIGEIQIGATNREEFQQYFKNVNSGNEYIHTNIVNKNKIIGGNDKHNVYRYVKTYWNFELDQITENTQFYKGEKVYCQQRKRYFYPNKLQLQEGYEILSATVFESFTGFFSEGILEGYNKKNEGKQEGNKIKEQANKTFINSFYGKLGSNPERHERYSFLNEENGLMEYKPTHITYFDNKKYYKAMASCVTAWGRYNLRDTLYSVCKVDPLTMACDGKFHNNVMYMDTDSLYTTLTQEQLKTIIPNKLKDSLGYWSIESEYTSFKAIGSKKYIFKGYKLNSKGSPKEEAKIKCKCAGLPEEARKTRNFSNFNIGEIIEGKKVKKKVKGGYALVYDTYTICNNIL